MIGNQHDRKNGTETCRPRSRSYLFGSFPVTGLGTSRGEILNLIGGSVLCWLSTALGKAIL